MEALRVFNISYGVSLVFWLIINMVLGYVYSTNELEQQIFIYFWVGYFVVIMVGLLLFNVVIRGTDYKWKNHNRFGLALNMCIIVGLVEIDVYLKFH